MPRSFWTLCVGLALVAAPAAAWAADGGLHLAVYQGNAAQVASLLAAGADPEARDVNGYTALHWAAYRGDRRVIGMLLSAGAALDARDGEGFTPLMLAVWRCQPDAAGQLLAAGADATLVSRGGSSALDLARAGGDARLIRLIEAAMAPEIAAAVPLGGGEALTVMPLPGSGGRPGPAAAVELQADDPLDALSRQPAFAKLNLAGLRTVPPAQWPGQRLVFLQGEPRVRILGEHDEAGLPDLGGRIATVVAFEDQARQRMRVRMDDDGAEYVLARGARWEGFALAADLVAARRAFRGQRVTCKATAITGLIEVNGAWASSREALPLPAGTVLRVEDVVPGEETANPVRLILAGPDGLRGCFDLAVSDTVAGAGRRFEGHFTRAK